MSKIKPYNAEISNGALKGKNLPKKLKILSWGKNDTVSGPVYLNNKTIESFDEWQKAHGRDEDVPLDFDHCTVPESEEYVAGKAKDIAAYGNPLLIKGDGLYLTDLEWTPLGEEKAKNYKDLSPAVKVDEDGSVLGLHSCALTPTGAVNGLKFYSVKDENIMLKKYSKDYNKDGANPGLHYSGEGQLGESNVNVHPKSADEEQKTKDEEALKKTKELEKHEEDEIKDECAYSGADSEWDNDKLNEHKRHVEALDAEDHETEYGDVDYADKKNHKYPINNEEHIRAAWSYINMPKNAEKYDSEELSTIKGHIKSAAEKHGIDIAEDDKKTETKTMSADFKKVELPAWRGAEPETMNNNIIKRMAAEVGMENESDTNRVLETFLAKYLGLLGEVKGQITTKENTQNGGLKQFSAEIENLKTEIRTLMADKQSELKDRIEFERSTLISTASKDGKFIPLSANALKTVDISVLRELVANAQKGVVPTTSKTKLFTANSGLTVEEKRQKSLDIINQNVKEQLSMTK